MERSRTSPVHWVAVVAGLGLAAAGVVRFAQGRPTRTIVAAAPAPTAASVAPPDPAAPTTEHSMEAMDSAPAGATTIAAAASTSPAATGEVKVDIINFTFAPDPLEVTVGTKVTWTNKDSFAHTATSDDRTTFDSGNLNQGQSFSFTFTKPGTYTYKCAIHNSMTGTVVVK